MDGSAGQTFGNSDEEIEDEWMRLVTNSDFDWASKSIHKKQSECESESE